MPERDNGKVNNNATTRKTIKVAHLRYAANFKYLRAANNDRLPYHRHGWWPFLQRYVQVVITYY